MPINNVIEGDLIKLALEGRYDAIAHGCNIYCTMGSGIAPQIAEAFPMARFVDDMTQSGEKAKLGTTTACVAELTHLEGKDNYIIVHNLYTQAEFGNPANGSHNVNYKAIVSCFRFLNDCYKDSDVLLGIPQIGAGLAKGHWEAIETIINLVTPDLDIELVMYKP